MNRAGFFHLFVALLSASAAARCGPGVQEGPESDFTEDTASGDTASGDTASGDGGGEPDDFDTQTSDNEPESFCAYPTIDSTVALSANELLTDSSFVAISSDCALASRQELDGYTAAVAFMSPDADNNVISAFQHSFSLEPKALSCRFDSVEKVYVAYILASDEAGSIVYELVDEVGEWNEVYRGAARLDGIHRLVRTSAPATDEICAFGDGVICASKSDAPLEWREEIPGGTGALISDITLISCEDDRCFAAVGQGGHVYIKQQSGWARQSVETGEDLLTVSASDDVFTAAGAGGLILHGNADGLASYRVLDGRDIVSIQWEDGRYFKGATQDGAVFEGEVQSNGVYICPDFSTVEGAVLDALFFSCDSSSRFLVLQENALIGAYECLDVIM